MHKIAWAVCPNCKILSLTLRLTAQYTAPSTQILGPTACAFVQWLQVAKACISACVTDYPGEGAEAEGVWEV